MASKKKERDGEMERWREREREMDRKTHTIKPNQCMISISSNLLEMNYLGLDWYRNDLQKESEMGHSKN